MRNFIQKKLCNPVVTGNTKSEVCILNNTRLPLQIQLWITQSDAWGYKGSVVLGWDVSLDISENNYISRTRYPGNESVIQFMTINISIHTRLMMSKQLKQLYYQHPHIKSGSRHWLIRVNEYIVSLLVYSVYFPKEGMQLWQCHCMGCKPVEKKNDI